MFTMTMVWHQMAFSDVSSHLDQTRIRKILEIEFLFFSCFTLELPLVDPTSCNTWDAHSIPNKEDNIFSDAFV